MIIKKTERKKEIHKTIKKTKPLYKQLHLSKFICKINGQNIYRIDTHEEEYLIH